MKRQLSLRVQEWSQQFGRQHIHTGGASSEASPPETTQCGRALGVQWPLSVHEILKSDSVAFTPAVRNPSFHQHCVRVSWSRVRVQRLGPREFVQVNLGG